MATLVQRNCVEEIRPTGLPNTDLTFNKGIVMLKSSNYRYLSMFYVKYKIIVYKRDEYPPRSLAKRHHCALRLPPYPNIFSPSERICGIICGERSAIFFSLSFFNL